MKKALILLLIVFPVFSIAQINIPDANFKAALINTTCIDTDGDYITDSDADTNDNGEIELEEALAVTYLNVSYHEIASMSGIENFTELRILNCEGNNLTELDISSLIHLTHFSCGGNSLSELNVMNLTELVSLYIYDNLLTTINLQTNFSLESFTCGSNLFEEINLCGTSVRYFTCTNNPYLTAIYLKNNVVSPEHARYIPPPPPTIYLYDLPMLELICYDEGELPAIMYATSPGELDGVELTTDCVMDCSLGGNSFEAVSTIAYPNPTSGIIHLSSAVSPDKISVYNNLGQLVKEERNPEKLTTMDLESLRTGIYHIQIQTGLDSTNLSIIKN